MLSTFSRFAQDAVYPYGSGGPNASFALIARNYMKRYGATREDFGKICVAQRANALSFPHALMKKPLTLDEYMSARAISDPIHLFDCVMPCAGAEAFLVCREDVAQGAGTARRPAARHHRAPQRLPRRPHPVSRRLGDGRAGALRHGRRDDRRRRLRADLRRLPGDLHDADGGPGLLRQGRGARLRPLAHAHRRRQLPAQHLRRPALGRPGGRGRRLPRPGRGRAPGHRQRAGRRRARRRRSASSRASAWSPTIAAWRAAPRCWREAAHDQASAAPQAQGPAQEDARAAAAAGNTQPHGARPHVRRRRGPLPAPGLQRLRHGGLSAARCLPALPVGAAAVQGRRQRRHASRRDHDPHLDRRLFPRAHAVAHRHRGARCRSVDRGAPARRLARGRKGPSAIEDRQIRPGDRHGAARSPTRPTWPTTRSGASSPAIPSFAAC